MTSPAFDIDRAHSAIVLRRTYAATLEQVFDAWTKPDHISQWWDPSGRPLRECLIDLRVGGMLRLVNDDEAMHAFEAVFVEITPPTQLVFNAMGAIGTVALVADGTRTDMTVTMACASPEHLEQFIKMGIADGTARTLDNLSGFLAD